MGVGGGLSGMTSGMEWGGLGDLKSLTIFSRKR